MSHAVTHCLDFLKVADDAVFFIGKCLKHNLDAFCVVRNRKLLIVLLTVPFVGEFAHLEADALQQTLG